MSGLPVALASGTPFPLWKLEVERSTKSMSPERKVSSAQVNGLWGLSLLFRVGWHFLGLPPSFLRLWRASWLREKAEGNPACRWGTSQITSNSEKTWLSPSLKAMQNSITHSVTPGV